MATKKYIITLLSIIFLFSIAILFIILSVINLDNPSNLYIYLIISSIFFILAITIFALTYKKLLAYEANRLAKKIEAMNFSVVEILETENNLREKLKKNYYKEIKNNFFLRKEESDTCGDGSGIIKHYYVALSQPEDMFDIDKCLEQFNKGLITYNICYVFINNNIERNLKKLKDYIKDTVVDVDIHRYRYKKFFAPIIICNSKIYFLKAGSFFSEYKESVVEGLRILGIK